MKPASSESHPMNGGDGNFSYNKNSYFQKMATSGAQDIIKKTISEKLEVTKLSPVTTLKIVDMGCSIGPNTFVAVQNIIQAVQTNHSISQQNIEFQVFFNDHVSNDFNTLFVSLPSQSDRPYYAAAVPGSFHSRLFPDSSIHIVHSSYALHWLSKVPGPVLDRDSPAWNKGRVHYTGGGADIEVYEAYRVQFMEDMGLFIKARAEEVVKGGLVVIVMPGISDSVPYSRGVFSFTFNLLDLALMDLVSEGKISEEEVDSFNFPVYAPSSSDMTRLVEGNGCFTVELLQITLPGSNITQPISAEAITMTFRAGMEGVITKHFGHEIIDQLFDRYLKRADENSSLLNSRAKESSQLVAILKRK